MRVVTASGTYNHQWSIRAPEDLHKRMQDAMPGHRDMSDAHRLHRLIATKGRRKDLTRQTDPTQVLALTTVLDFSQCKRVLDP